MKAGELQTIRTIAALNTAAKRTAHEYEFELPVETHFRLCIKI